MNTCTSNSSTSDAPHVTQEILYFESFFRLGATQRDQQTPEIFPFPHQHLLLDLIITQSHPQIYVHKAVKNPTVKGLHYSLLPPAHHAFTNKSCATYHLLPSSAALHTVQLSLSILRSGLPPSSVPLFYSTPE